MDPLKNNKFNLDDLKNHNPFQVPEHYFDSLGTRISDKIVVTAPQKKEPLFARLKLKPVLAFSGGFTGIAILVYFGFSVFFKNTETIKNTSTSEIANVNEFSIVSELDEATLIEEFSNTGSVQTDSVNSAHKDHIIDYLVKEDIEISTIIEAL